MRRRGGEEERRRRGEERTRSLQPAPLTPVNLWKTHTAATESTRWSWRLEQLLIKEHNSFKCDVWWADTFEGNVRPKKMWHLTCICALMWMRHGLCEAGETVTAHSLLEPEESPGPSSRFVCVCVCVCVCMWYKHVHCTLYGLRQEEPAFPPLPPVLLLGWRWEHVSTLKLAGLNILKEGVSLTVCVFVCVYEWQSEETDSVTQVPSVTTHWFS